MNAVGQPISRADGRLKVTGGARYTADIPLADAAHAAIAHSTIANGRTVSIDTATAEKAPGVLAVFTHRNMPRMNPTPKPWSHLHPHGQGYLPLQDDKIHHAGQPIALVVATTRDQATHAGTLISAEYEAEPPVVFSRQMAKEAVDPPQFLWPVASSVGDADKGIRDGAVRIEQTYTTSDRHHNQMEPHATAAVWDADGTLTLYETTQHIFGAKELVSIVLGEPIEKINVVCHFLGGGFGGKAYVWPHTLLTALAARILNRPVRIQLTRAQMYSMVGHQPATIQTIALGADKDGKLAGIRHESISPAPVFDNYIEYAALASRSLWAASGGIATNHKIVHVNRNTPTAMRSPHEALGHFALESAMDELAYATGVDPVALRLLNDTEIDPHSGRPFSTRAMRKCLTEGAARFGWDKRTPAPRSMRDARCAMRDARWPVSRWSGDGKRDLHTLAMTGQSASYHRSSRIGFRRGRDARSRHRHLYGNAAGSRRRARSCAGECDCATGRHEIARVPRINRFGHDGQRWRVGHARGEGCPRQGDRAGSDRSGGPLCRFGSR
jgi:xanthine dehydrogenase YagR molybdenum-binding subunit